jgi:hypothetical protein
VSGSFRIAKGEEAIKAFSEGLNILFTHHGEDYIKAAIGALEEIGLTPREDDWRSIFREVPYSEFVPEAATRINYAYNALNRAREGSLIIEDNPLTLIILTPQATALFASEEAVQYFAYTEYQEETLFLKSKPPTTAERAPPLLLKLASRPPAHDRERGKPPRAQLRKPKP